MGFSWSETITANTTNIKVSHITELQTNINIDRIQVGLAGFTWSHVPSMYDVILTTPDLLELRTALDQGKNNSGLCTSYNSGLLSGVLGYDLSGQATSYYTGDCGGMNSVVDNYQHSAHNPARNAADQTFNVITQNSTFK